MAYQALKHEVANRGKPPSMFLDALIAWGKAAADEIFAPNQHSDVYDSVKDVLGPYRDATHRKAVMLEVMRVLAGFESSWKWTAGRDTTNPTSDKPDTEEAGAWQVSANSMHFGQDLKDLVQAQLGSLDPDKFRDGMKQNHSLAMEYIARLLRHTVAANGPVKRHEVDEWLQPEAVKELELLLV